MTAAEKLLQKQLVTAGIDSAGWDVVNAGLKDRAFFSARIESLRFLQEAQQKLGDLLAHARNTDGAITSRAQLVSDFMRTAREEGIATGTGSLSDPGSSKRAQVIIDTQAGLARNYTGYVTGSTRGAMLAYPAQELIRIEPRDQPRDWRAKWIAAGGQLYGGRMIARKDSTVWEKLSRFGVPYPPFDYGSGMGVDLISYEDAVALGVIQPDYDPGESDPVADFNTRLEADLEISGPTDPVWIWLKDVFKKQIEIANGKVRWIPKPHA
jgi:hypothetical protein